MISTRHHRASYRHGKLLLLGVVRQHENTWSRPRLAQLPSHLQLISLAWSPPLPKLRPLTGLWSRVGAANSLSHLWAFSSHQRKNNKALFGARWFLPLACFTVVFTTVFGLLWDTLYTENNLFLCQAVTCRFLAFFLLFFSAFSFLLLCFIVCLVSPPFVKLDNKKRKQPFSLTVKSVPVLCSFLPLMCRNDSHDTCYTFGKIQSGRGFSVPISFFLLTSSSIFRNKTNMYGYAGEVDRNLFEIAACDHF